MSTLRRYKLEQFDAIYEDDCTIIERMLYSVRLQVTAFQGCIVLVSRAARIETETKSFWDTYLQIIFAFGQTYSVNP